MKKAPFHGDSLQSNERCLNGRVHCADTPYQATGGDRAPGGWKLAENWLETGSQPAGSQRASGQEQQCRVAGTVQHL